MCSVSLIASALCRERMIKFVEVTASEAASSIGRDLRRSPNVSPLQHLTWPNGTKLARASGNLLSVQILKPTDSQLSFGSQGIPKVGFP